METKKLISLFNRVRDVPYRIAEIAGSKENTCYTKHLLLKECLEKLNVPVRPRVCSFSWRNLPIPRRLLRIEHTNSHHVYLEAVINDRWINLDATWDKGLEKVLPVNYWDGISPTTIAVPPTKIYSPRESLSLFSEEDDIEEDLRKNGLFYKAFNEWLESNRRR